MGNKRTIRLAWALCALVCGLSAVELALRLAGPSAPRLAPALIATTLEAAVPVVFAVVATLIVAHQPRNTIGWLLTWIGLGCTIAGAITGYVPLLAAAMPDPTPILLLNAWFNSWIWWLQIGPLLLICCCFPPAARLRRAGAG
jgi:hypothetical protein